MLSHQGHDTDNQQGHILLIITEGTQQSMSALICGLTKL